MSFQAYIANVEAKTGNAIGQIIAGAEAEGLTNAGTLASGVKAGQVVAWLQDRYGLGHGHAMAVVAYIKGKRT